MSIRIGNARVGHRVGGFYVSAPLTGRNAGRRFRVGHRLPGGSYGSVPVTVTSGRPQPPASLGVQIVATAVTAFLVGWLAVSTGSWWLFASLAGGLGWQWVRWARSRRL
jgi:hypothetical protein